MRLTLARIVLVSHITLLWALVGHAVAQPSVILLVHHDLAVTIDPATHHIRAHDRIRVPGALVTASFTIALNADLKVQAASGGLKLVPAGSRLRGSDSGIDRDNDGSASRVPVSVYRVEGATPGQDLTGELSYEGVVN
jgi:hypothetical protein